MCSERAHSVAYFLQNFRIKYIFFTLIKNNFRFLRERSLNQRSAMANEESTRIGRLISTRNLSCSYTIWILNSQLSLKNIFIRKLYYQLDNSVKLTIGLRNVTLLETIPCLGSYFTLSIWHHWPTRIFRAFNLQTFFDRNIYIYIYIIYICRCWRF